MRRELLGLSPKGGSERGQQRTRVLVVANRLPVTAVPEAGAVRYRRSDGGLVAGLLQVARKWPIVWYGWDGIASDAADVRALPDWEGGSLMSIPLTENEIQAFYRQYCNCVLWPMLHGITDDLPRDPHAWEQYVTVNRRYAEAIMNTVNPGDRIWIHDYHLFLLPQLLRQREPNLPIAFFLHTPLPSFETLRAVPQYQDVIHGMLGADVIGFHTPEYTRAFLDAATRLGFPVEGDRVQAGDRRVEVKTRPMGIDVAAFARLATDPGVLAEVECIKAANKTMLLGVDRLDYTKGIPERLLAFELLLQEQKELRGQVSLVQIAVPSRGEIAAYRDLRDVVETIVERINKRFGTSGWTPVQYLYDTVDLNTLVSLYRAADVMVVTAYRDGLNLVAKEFVATRTDGDGVLILSKYAGAAHELHSALQVDPNHVRSIADAYQRALSMPAVERKARMRHLRTAIAPNNVIAWAKEFLDVLYGSANTNSAVPRGAPYISGA